MVGEPEGVFVLDVEVFLGVTGGGARGGSNETVCIGTGGNTRKGVSLSFLSFKKGEEEAGEQ